MSYDIDILDDQGNQMTVPEPHQLRGGTYQVGGSTELHLNITYNYAPYFYEAFGEKGIRELYGKKVVDTVQAIAHAIVEITGMTHIEDRLKRETEERAQAAQGTLALKIGIPKPEWKPDDYWCPTRANAAKALQDLLQLASLGLQGTWDGD